jgi:hypothetical protein
MQFSLLLYLQEVQWRAPSAPPPPLPSITHPFRPDPAQNLDADPDPDPDPGGGEGVSQPKMEKKFLN